MNIEITNIKVFDKMSEETNAFHATIRIDGKPVGEAKNSGTGGMTDYYATHHDFLPLIKEAEEYCKQLPPLKLSDGTLPMDLELYIDTKVEEFIRQREMEKIKKKIQKHQDTAIVYGTELSFMAAHWILKSGKKAPISYMLEKHPDQVKKQIETIKGMLEPGERIFNTNIPKELL